MHKAPVNYHCTSRVPLFIQKLARWLLFALLFFTSTPTVYGRDSLQVKLPLIRQQDQLRKAIREYRQLAATACWNSFPATLQLRLGDSSRYVPMLQENLISTKDLAPAQATFDFCYTPDLAQAVSRFQRRHGLRADGIVGRNTIKALNVPLSQRLLQLENNLTRWPALADTLRQPYMLINIPDYTLRIIKENKTLMQMRVIPGKPTQPTLLVESKLNMVVLNPNWYIPSSIALEEIVPLLRRNPGYLARKNMQLLQRNAAGRYVAVDPNEVNWHRVNKSNFNYKIVQQPGEHNELGRVKFLFRNRVAQYLHDTPNKGLFKEQQRAFSHGCIRLERPMELADYLLKHHAGYTGKAIEKLKSGDTPDLYLKLRRPMPVAIVYLTAWVNEENQVQFRQDVYGYDKRLQTPQKQLQLTQR